MPSLNLLKLLGLPQNHNGAGVTILLTASLALAIAQLVLSIPAARELQGYIFISTIVPIIAYYLAFFILLQFHRDTISASTHASGYLTTRLNISFMVFIGLVWLGSTALGFWLAIGPDGEGSISFEVTSGMLGVFGSLTHWAVVLFCVSERQEGGYLRGLSQVMS
ncbi:hypothetical protein FRC12_023028 [Ceratobasidium sp. 428]|nr:hypothetical protein FRC12_023028 [Ceratobasidium sp. 428]